MDPLGESGGIVRKTRAVVRWLWDNDVLVRGWLSGLAVAMILWVYVHPVLGVTVGAIVASVLLLVPGYLARRSDK